MTKATPKKDEQKENENPTTLVGWARCSKAGSLHTEAVSGCSTYTTADGSDYVPLVISMAALRRVIDGQQAVTTVSQFQES